MYSSPSLNKLPLIDAASIDYAAPALAPAPAPVPELGAGALGGDGGAGCGGVGALRRQPLQQLGEHTGFA